ncbi:MAG: hypothetical protein QW343_03260 [Candidatus Norongarragalinales archaeon]
MKQALFALCFLALAVAFAGVYGAEAFSGVKIRFSPPYYYASNDVLGAINAFSFAFLFSLLFFGYGGPIAMLVEGAKHASFLASGAASVFDAAFALPSLLACFSGVALGQGALREWRGTGSFFEEWSGAARFFAAGAVLLGVLLVAKRFV